MQQVYDKVDFKLSYIGAYVPFVCSTVVIIIKRSNGR